MSTRKYFSPHSTFEKSDCEDRVANMNVDERSECQHHQASVRPSLLQHRSRQIVDHKQLDRLNHQAPRTDAQTRDETHEQIHGQTIAPIDLEDDHAAARPLRSRDDERRMLSKQGSPRYLYLWWRFSLPRNQQTRRTIHLRTGHFLHCSPASQLLRHSPTE